MVELLKIELLTDKRVVQETTNRIGIANKKKKVLYPSCYVYEMNNETYLVHFKELFAIRENGYNNVSDEDINRRNAIAFLLTNWGLIYVDEKSIQPHDSYVFVLSHKFKKEWFISHKVNLFTLNE